MAVAPSIECCAAPSVHAESFGASKRDLPWHLDGLDAGTPRRKWQCAGPGQLSCKLDELPAPVRAATDTVSHTPTQSRLWRSRIRRGTAARQEQEIAAMSPTAGCRSVPHRPCGASARTAWPSDGLASERVVARRGGGATRARRHAAAAASPCTPDRIGDARRTAGQAGQARCAPPVRTARSELSCADRQS